MHTTRLIPSLTLLVAMMAPIPAFAQTPPPAAPPPPPVQQQHGGIGIGAKIGPLFSNVSIEGISDTSLETRSGWIGGLFIGGNRPGIVGVGVDILYARRGAKAQTGDQTLDLDYINVPVYLRINAGSDNINKGAIAYGVVGVDLSFLLKARGFSVDEDDFTRADYGVVVGVGAEISRFVIEGRYTKGLGNIAKDKDDPVTKNTSFAVMLGVRFN